MSRKFNPNEELKGPPGPLHNLAAAYVAANDLDDKLIGEIVILLADFVKGLRTQFSHDTTGVLIEHGHDLMHEVLDQMGIIGWPTLVRMKGALELGTQVHFTREDEIEDKVWDFEGEIVGYYLRKGQEARYRVVYSGEKIGKGVHDGMLAEEFEVVE